MITLPEMYNHPPRPLGTLKSGQRKCGHPISVITSVGYFQCIDTCSHNLHSMPNGHIKVHINPTGYRRCPHVGPTLKNIAKLQGELMTKVKQKALGAIFSEHAKAMNASEFDILCQGDL
jgi:hypothetical protein